METEQPNDPNTPIDPSAPSVPPVSAPTVPSVQNGLPFVDGSIDDVGKSTAHYLRRRLPYVLAAVIATVALEAGFCYMKIIDVDIYILPLLIPFFGYHWVRGRVQHEFMQQFAEGNGYAYAAHGTLDGLDGSLFQIGYDKSAIDVVSGQYKDSPITLLSYTYVTGAGRSRQEHHYTVFELQFDTVMPDILLENAGHTFGEALIDKLSGKELVKLEGDFNKYFSVSVPKGYEVEALEIFTPDVMEQLIEKSRSLSLEIVRDHLFVYANRIIGTKADLYAVYELARYFVEELGPVLTRMKSSVEAMEQYKAG